MPSAGTRPWLALYDPGLPTGISPSESSCLDLFRASRMRLGDQPLVRYFDATLTFADADEQSDALAVGLSELGFGRGDRLGLVLQNVPAFFVAALAAWKLGGVVVPISPLLKQRELAHVLEDSGAIVVVTSESDGPRLSASIDGTAVRTLVTSSELDGLDAMPAPLAGIERRFASNTLDLRGLIEKHGGSRPGPVVLRGDEPAYVSYTSGTTGPQKGSIATHANVVFNAHAYRAWASLSEDDVVLGVAPLFHITGLVAYVAVSLLVGAPTVLSHRFEAGAMLELAERYGASFTVGSITAFIALMNHPAARHTDLGRLTKAFSGGAPVAPATLAAWERTFGTYVHNIYGLTETASPSHAVPLGRRAPVDPLTGALSVGVPIFDTDVRIVDDEGNELPVGVVGELATRGPQVTPGYWGNSEATRLALHDGELRTGDLGFMDEDGWFYVVDRKKDLINTSGFKVWPREVEDVLYEHPAVLEAAVVGLADDYRGEAVMAFVSLREGQSADEAELIAHCRDRLAVYKAPRSVAILADLPKTATGKILRRELRERPPQEVVS